MAESSNPTPISSPPEVVPKEEPVTLDRPESPNPFLPAYQVDFTFDQITFNTNNEKVPKGKKHRAISGLRRKQSSKHTSESKTKASKSKTSQSDKETQSNLAKDKSPSHPSVSIPMDAELHKEDQQAAGGPTSLRVTSEEGAILQGMDKGTKNYAPDHIFAGTNPSVLVDSTKFGRDGLTTNHTKTGATKDMRFAFMDTDSNEDEPIIVLLLKSLNLKLKQEKDKAEAEVAFLNAKPLYPNVNQLTELLVPSIKLEISKLLSSHEFSSSLPDELKELPLKINALSREVKEPTLDSEESWYEMHVEEQEHKKSERETLQVLHNTA
ncbi:hypothetical protein Tco_1019053 [Tanacetum coccineum]|uniref:Uncharacterized protein n=1 Tax=Tanacetum coccineum TaxID=301880 RepID=A0ABQ5FW35_9ASTR